MKKTEKFIVIRSTETGHYLVKYENNEGAFAYSATWSEDLQDAATNSLESMQKEANKSQKLAESFGGELIEVTATYELKTLDGNEPRDLTEEIEEAKRKHFGNFLRGLLGDDEED